MQDRNPTYPGRVRLIPVDGSTDLFDMVRADEPTQPGTMLNKQNLLPDDVASAFGLDESGVPADVLNFLKFLNQYVWITVDGVTGEKTVAYTDREDETPGGGNAPQLVPIGESGWEFVAEYQYAEDDGGVVVDNRVVVVANDITVDENGQLVVHGMRYVEIEADIENYTTNISEAILGKFWARSEQELRTNPFFSYTNVDEYINVPDDYSYHWMVDVLTQKYGVSGGEGGENILLGKFKDIFAKFALE